ncbi:hypothetical protein IAD21_03384 [Abditibacteriota bacterium]|nr:hypothetical protein IAD21_03384 [Abditibacteriota bacterium]
MVNVSKLRVRERAFRRLVGLSVFEFDQLVAAVAQEEAAQRARCAAPRVRAVGAGHPFALALPERVLAVVLFYRLHLTGHLLSCLFSLDESNLWRDRTHRLAPMLLFVLPVPVHDHLLSALEEAKDSSKEAPVPAEGDKKKAPRRRIGTLKELLEAFPELRDVCADGTEQQVPKPKCKRESRQFYSGKSQCHTVKSQITTARRLILHVTGNTPGAVSDRLLLKASGVIHALEGAASPEKRKSRRGKRAPRVTKRRLRLDRGYSGIEKEYPLLQRVQILAALKGTKHSKVTLLGRMWNRVMVSRQRIQVEQNIGHLKNWRVLSGLYRARVCTHQNTLTLVAGLHNFTLLGRLHWQP